MMAGTMRDLTGPAQKSAIRDLLQALFIAELLAPSSRLWLASAWVSDIDVLDNTARQLGALSPDWPARPIRLSEVFRALVARGGRVAVIVREARHNDDFVARVRHLAVLAPAQVGLVVAPEFHEKGLVGDDFALSGSMNFTNSGISTNDEHLVFRRDAASVRERQVSLQAKWGALLP